MYSFWCGLDKLGHPVCYSVEERLLVKNKNPADYI